MATKYKVLKPFQYAPNGTDTGYVAEGDVLVALNPAFVAGLVAEGYIEEDTSAPAPVPPQEPTPNPTPAPPAAQTPTPPPADAKPKGAAKA